MPLVSETPSPAAPLFDDGREAAVEVQGVNHFFGQGELRKQVLFENRLRLFPGEIVIMTGPSGSGKTTLLTLIGALRTLQEGSLKVRGREYGGLSADELVQVRRGIGFIFQAHNLFGSLTAFQNVRMALELRDHGVREMKTKAEEMLTRLGMGARVHHKPHQLSGGQRQRVAIARALVNRPKLILADEPTAALDKQSGRDVVTLLQEFARTEQSTILMVTHDSRILDVADRIVNMVDGRIISDVVVGETMEKCEFLRHCSLFAEFTPTTLSEVADQMVRVSFPAGADVVRQGAEGDRFYIIRTGELEVKVSGASGVKRVAQLKSGDFFGEAALLTGEPRNATVTALTDVELFSLGKLEFQRVVQASAGFMDQLRKVLFQRQ